MSDFLGRLAARAVGAPSPAQPRSPVPVAGAAAGGIEVVEERVVGAGAPPSALPQPRGEPGRAEPPLVLAATPVPAALVEASPIGQVAPRAAAAAEAPRFVRARPGRGAVPADPTDTEPDAAAAEPRASVAVTAVPATPAAPALAAPSRPPASATVAAARDEAPPVRVHIGRLEVRASLVEPPRPRTLSEPREPEGLSLSDYLRGRRGA